MSSRFVLTTKGLGNTIECSLGLTTPSDACQQMKFRPISIKYTHQTTIRNVTPATCNRIQHVPSQRYRSFSTSAINYPKGPRTPKIGLWVPNTTNIIVPYYLGPWTLRARRRCGFCSSKPSRRQLALWQLLGAVLRVQSPRDGWER